MYTDDTPSQLKIYVPVDDTVRDICFGSSMPLRLADWLIRDPVTRIIPNKMAGMKDLITALTTLLGSRASSTHQILDHHGIVCVDIPSGVEEIEEVGEEVQQQGETQTPAASELNGGRSGDEDDNGVDESDQYHDDDDDDDDDDDHDEPRSPEILDSIDSSSNGEAMPPETPASRHGIESMRLPAAGSGNGVFAQRTTHLRHHQRVHCPRPVPADSFPTLTRSSPRGSPSWSEDGRSCV